MKLLLLLLLCLSTAVMGQEMPLPVEPDKFMLVILALLAISEFLSVFPKIESNGIFQLIVNILKKIAGK